MSGASFLQFCAISQNTEKEKLRHKIEELENMVQKQSQVHKNQDEIIMHHLDTSIKHVLDHRIPKLESSLSSMIKSARENDYRLNGSFHGLKANFEDFTGKISEMERFMGMVDANHKDHLEKHHLRGNHDGKLDNSYIQKVIKAVLENSTLSHEFHLEGENKKVQLKGANS